MNSDLAKEFRLVAMDIRGHGLSAMPRDAYGDSKLWADDVNAVIQTKRAFVFSGLGRAEFSSSRACSGILLSGLVAGAMSPLTGVGLQGTLALAGAARR